MALTYLMALTHATLYPLTNWEGGSIKLKMDIFLFHELIYTTLLLKLLIFKTKVNILYKNI